MNAFTWILILVVVGGWFYWKKGGRTPEWLNLTPKPTDKDLERLTALAKKLESEADLAVKVKEQKDKIALARKRIAEARTAKQSLF